MAQIALVQEPPPYERAVLFTGIFYSHDSEVIQHTLRFSESLVNQDYFLDQAHIPQQVRHRLIQAKCRWRFILAEPAEPIHLPNGASVVIHVRPPFAQQERWRFEAHQDRSKSPRKFAQADNEDDAVTLMAHQAQPPDPSASVTDMQEVAEQDDVYDLDSPTSSSGSTYASDVQSHFFHIFGVARPMHAARVRTDTWANMHTNIRPSST